MSFSKSPRIAVIGSSNTDLILKCTRLPRAGETLLGADLLRAQGGKGANQAVAMARAGAYVIFVGARGDDDFGRLAAQALRREKIDVRHFTVHRKTRSGVALILVGKQSGENMIAVSKSANDIVDARHVAKAKDKIESCQLVVSQLEIPLEGVIEAARIAKKADIPFILNPSPVGRLPLSLLRLVHTLVPNEHEATLLTGENDPLRAGRKLLHKGCGRVVVTLGHRGALLIDKQGEQHFPTPKVKAKDTVGAGDCFLGWLAVGIAEKNAIEKSIKRAILAASVFVTQSGAQFSLPYRHEISAI